YARARARLPLMTAGLNLTADGSNGSASALVRASTSGKGRVGSPEGVVGTCMACPPLLAGGEGRPVQGCWFRGTVVGVMPPLVPRIHPNCSERTILLSTLAGRIAPKPTSFASLKSRGGRGKSAPCRAGGGTTYRKSHQPLRSEP